MLSILWTILIGFVVGLIARAIKPGNDKLSLAWTMVLGVGGALLAKFVGQAMGWYVEGEPAGFIASVVFAIVLLFLYAAAKKNKTS
jgi:uncharacterized membrane protein YeaQ/YmgE (transglycosylase-associated protein family)